MELSLTPLDLARRARKLYADREAVVDGSNRWTYADFSRAVIAGLPRCTGWGSVQGDRGAIIAPNTHPAADR
jgi:fatty-acyl-CoA synthase